MKKLFFIGLLWLLFPLLAACTQSPPASLTPFPTDNETAAAIAFLDAAQQRYSDNLTCGGSVYTPDLRISESDFLGLVLYDPNPRNGVSYCRYQGQPYEYRAFF